MRLEPASAALHAIEPPPTAGVSLGVWLGRVAGADRKRVEAILREAAFTGRPFSCEYDLLAEDGSVRRLLARGQAIDGGDGIGACLLGVVVDLTELPPEAALSRTLEHVESIADSIDQMIWSTRPDGFHDYYNQRWYEYTGVPFGSTDGDAWNGMFHPDDQQRAWAVWRHSLATGDPYHIEYRLRHRSGQYRWVIGRAQCVRDTNGEILRWYGTCTDVHDLKQAEAERELIAQELSHRLKNMFAVITSLVALSARSQPEARAFASSFQSRISALALAHEYIRPHGGPASSGAQQTAHGLLQTLTAAYRTELHDRILLTGDDVPIGSQAATALALITHELCTNAVKYGALSAERGRIDLHTERQDDWYRLTWREQDGPKLQGAPDRRGFGSTLSERVINAQLKATVTQDWRPEGLLFTMNVPVSRLAQ